MKLLPSDLAGDLTRAPRRVPSGLRIWGGGRDNRCSFGMWVDTCRTHYGPHPSPNPMNPVPSVYLNR